MSQQMMDMMHMFMSWMQSMGWSMPMWMPMPMM
jgi:hypothetical protein